MIGKSKDVKYGELSRNEQEGEKMNTLVLHSNKDKGHLLYIMADAIDYYERCESATLIFLRGGNAVNVFESPEEISKMLNRNAGNISLTDTRSEPDGRLNWK